MAMLPERVCESLGRESRGKVTIFLWEAVHISASRWSDSVRGTDSHSLGCGNGGWAIDPGLRPADTLGPSVSPRDTFQKLKDLDLAFVFVDATYTEPTAFESR